MEAEFYNEQTQGLTINLDSRNFLKNTAKWGRFLAIIGFVFFGLIILGGLIGLFISTRSQISGLGGLLLSGALISFFYLALGLLYFLPILYLYKFSQKMIRGLEHNDEDVISDSFKNLKSLFKFMGILTIIILVVYTIALLVMPFGAFMGAFM